MPTTVALARRRFALMAAEHTVRLGKRIKELREERKLTQRELAEAIPGKADGTQISKWERGLHRPSDDTLEHIAKALGVKVSALHLSAVEPSTPDLMGALADVSDSERLRSIERKLDRLLALAEGPDVIDGVFETPDVPVEPTASPAQPARSRRGRGGQGKRPA